jgi:hypothetical protein
MGFLDGFLGGVVSQHQRIEDQNREDAQQSQQREQAVLQHLLNSDDPEIKKLAVAGMLQSTQPKKRKGGFAGWLGEMQNNPHMDKISALVAQDQAVGHTVPTEVAHAAGKHVVAGDPASAVAAVTTGAQPAAAPAGPALRPTGEPPLDMAGYTGPPPPVPPEEVTAPPSTSAPAGSPAGSAVTSGVGAPGGEAPAPAVPSVVASPTPAAGPGSAAMTGGKSLTEVGSAPPSPTTTPAPEAPAQTAVPAALLGQPKPPADQAASPMAPPTSGMVGSTPPAAVDAVTKPGIHPTAVLGQPQPAPAQPPVGAGPGSPRGDVFRTPETQARLTKKAQSQGDVEGDVAGYVSMGMTQEEAVAQVRAERIRRGTGQAGGYQGVAGEMPDPENPGKMIRVNGAFDRAKGTYVGTDPDSPYYGIPIPGFVSRQTGAQGQTPEQIKANTAARLQATNEAKLDAPIGVTAAERYGVPANTTLRQLTDKIPLSQADQDKIHGISTLEGSLNTVESLLPKVFPDVGTGFGARIKTALSLFSQSAGRQTDITALNAAIASTMAGIVRANGITQRLNVKELDLAQQQMVNTSVLHGDTLDSAQEKMVILRDLISRVQTGPIAQAVPGATPPVGAPPPPPGASAATPAGTAAPAAGPPPAAGAAPAAAQKPAPATAAAAAPPAAKPPVKAGAAPAKAPAAAKATPAPAGSTRVNGVLHCNGKPY